MGAEEYDLFKGRPQKNPFRIGRITGLKKAVDQMNRIAERFPDDYFLSDSAKNEVIVAIQQGPAGPIRVVPLSKAQGQAG